MAPDPTKIVVQGAREQNLKNISFELPKGKLIAITGPSGSGKSTIAIEILQRECLRQYLESLGMTTDHLAKANVDRISGLGNEQYHRLGSIGQCQAVGSWRLLAFAFSKS